MPDGDGRGVPGGRGGPPYGRAVVAVRVGEMQHLVPEDVLQDQLRFAQFAPQGPRRGVSSWGWVTVWAPTSIPYRSSSGACARVIIGAGGSRQGRPGVMAPVVR